MTATPPWSETQMGRMHDRQVPLVDRLAEALRLTVEYVNGSTPAHDVGGRWQPLLPDAPGWAWRDALEAYQLERQVDPEPEAPSAARAYVHLLTDDEHECIRLLGRASNLFGAIVAGSPTRTADMAELVHHVHVLQRTIGSQAAARAFPDSYRLLGGSLRDRSLDGVADELRAKFVDALPDGARVVFDTSPLILRGAVPSDPPRTFTRDIGPFGRAVDPTPEDVYLDQLRDNAVRRFAVGLAAETRPLPHPVDTAAHDAYLEDQQARWDEFMAATPRAPERAEPACIDAPAPAGRTLDLLERDRDVSIWWTVAAVAVVLAVLFAAAVWA